MLVKFILTMEDAIVDFDHCVECFDKIILQWLSNLDQPEILEISHRWLTTERYLVNRMVGLLRVGGSSLEIEPIEDIPEFNIPM